MKTWKYGLFVAAALSGAATAAGLSAPNRDAGVAPPENWEEIAPIVRERLECRGTGEMEASVRKAFRNGAVIYPPRNFTLLGLQVQPLRLENNHLSATLAAPLELVREFIRTGTVRYITTPGDSPALTYITCEKK
jgi:hypothetical protein